MGTTCQNCELCNNSQNPCVMGKGSKKAKIMFIQDCPNELDDKREQPFFGKSCTAVKNAMDSRGIDLKDVYFTSLVKCVAPNEQPKPAHIDACIDLLEAEISVVDPEIIIPTGNMSLRYCLGKGALTKVRGNAQEAEICGKKRIVLPTMHPRSVLKKPAYKQFILKDMDTLKDLYENGMTKVSGVNYKYLETLEDCIIEIVRLKNEAKILCFDLETTGKSPYMENSKIVCISLTDKTHSGCVIPLYHRQTPLWGQEIGTVVKLLRWLLEDESIPKVAHNGKFDIEWLHWWLDIDVKNFCFDTMLAHYLAVSEEQGEQGLKKLAWEFTDMGGYDNDLDEFRNTLPEAIRFNYDNIPWDILKTYAVADVDCCLRLYYLFKPLIDENEQWSIVFNDIMMPASYALRDIEENGMKFDVKLAEKYKETYGAEIARITERLESYPEVLQLERQKAELWAERQAIGQIPKKDRTPEQQEKFEKYKKYQDYKFNWNSVQQLGELLFDKLGLVTTILTDTGAFSTNEDALTEMSEQHEVPALLMELRKVTTLNNMFIEKLPDMRDKDDIVHPSFNISGCVVGDTLIPTSEGLYKISDIIGDTPPGEFVDKVLSIVNFRGELENTSKIVRFSGRETIKLTTQLGFSIEGTTNHPIIVNKWNKKQICYNQSTRDKALLPESREWKQLQDITDLDLIAIPYGQNCYGNTLLEIEPWEFTEYQNVTKIPEKLPTKITEDLALLLGMYYADGCIKDGNGSWNIEICNKDADVVSELSRISLELFGLETTVYSDSDTSYTGIGCINLRPLESVLELQRGCLNKTIPQYILSAPKNIQSAYIRGMTLDSSYNIDGSRHELKICCAREDVAKTLQLMLINMGIIAAYRQDKYSSNTFEVFVYNSEYCKFRDQIGFVQSKKADYSYEVEETCRKNYFVDYEHHTLWLRIKSIENSLADVYDFTVPNTHSFISNGFISHNTVTGRMSSENPNAQQFPRKAEQPLLFQYHNEPKALFTSRYGKNGCILNADYSALEMRIAGIVSEDPTLLQAFLSGQDLHKSTASLVWGMPIDEVTKDQRTAAKKVNFGIIYGKSGTTFARDEYYDPSGKNPNKTTDWDEAKRIGNKLVDDYLNAFSGLRDWLENTKKFAYKNGYVETLFGRRRRLPDLKSKVQTLKSNAERQSINAPIQGTGSDFTLLSLIKIQDWLEQTKKKSMIIATVHDSIVFDVYIPELPVVAKEVKDIMEHVHEPYIDTPVPIISELELGRNYGSTFDVDLDTCLQLDTAEAFAKWNHDNCLKKYQKEISELHKEGWDYKQVLEYLKKYDRPVKELFDYIVDTYSEEKEGD